LRCKTNSSRGLSARYAVLLVIRPLTNIDRFSQNSNNGSISRFLALGKAIIEAIIEASIEPITKQITTYLYLLRALYSSGVMQYPSTPGRFGLGLR